jgi:hypothetical protein
MPSGISAASLPQERDVCTSPTYLWSPFWFPCYLLGLATATASMWSAAVLPLTCKRPSSSLIRLHIKTLKLNPHAGLRQPYEMQGRPLHLVPQSSKAS